MDMYASTSDFRAGDTERVNTPLVFFNFIITTIFAFTYTFSGAVDFVPYRLH